MTGFAIPLEFRSAVEGAVLAADHLRSQILPDVPPAEGPIAAGFTRYAPDSNELQTWLAWRRLILLGLAWAKWQAALEAATKAAAAEAALADPPAEAPP